MNNTTIPQQGKFIIGVSPSRAPLPFYKRIFPSNWKTSKRFLKSDYFTEDQRSVLSVICGIPKSQRTSEQAEYLETMKRGNFKHNHPSTSSSATPRADFYSRPASYAFGLFAVSAFIGSAANSVAQKKYGEAATYVAVILIAAAGMLSLRFVKPGKNPVSPSQSGN